MSSQTPRVESFVLRFVADAPDAGLAPEAQPDASAASRPDHLAARGWHGVVVHVQTNEGKPFTNFADAVAFIARFVPVGDFILQGEDEPPTTSTPT